MRKYYTGVGSRKAPKHILDVLQQTASMLEHQHTILRSGGAQGCDTAFYQGVVDKRKADIYVPWCGFSGFQMRECQKDTNLSQQAYDIAKYIHPAWHRCSPSAQKLHTRNIFQVLGDDLNTPSEFLVCWTPEGETVGGTATAIRLAEIYNVPVVNVGIDRVYQQLLKRLEAWKAKEKKCLIL